MKKTITTPDIDSDLSPDYEEGSPDFKSKSNGSNWGSVEFGKARKNYLNTIIIMSIGWIIVVIFILFFQGLKVCGFNLSDPVLITFLGTTTGTVLTSFIIVSRYFFPSQK